jgi:ribonucleoside-diphosphate reductase alpha chain
VSELAQDTAIVASIALQSGCPLETLRHALSGRGEGPLSAALELIRG